MAEDLDPARRSPGAGGAALDRRRLLRGLGAAALSAPFAAPVSAQPAGGPQAGRRRVRLRLKWLHQFQFAGFYLAKELGLYERAGLEVELLEGGPDVDPAGSVLSGEAEFGIGNSSLLLERAAGHPVVVLAVMLQHSPFVLLARAGDDLRSVHDLAGKTLMLETHAAELMAYLHAERVPTGSIRVLPHTADALVLGSGAADAISAYTTTEPYLLKAAGIPYQVMNPRAAGIDFYGDALFTTESFARKERDLVLAFRSASLEGWRHAMRDPAAAIDLILAKYAPGMDRGRLAFEAEEIRRLMLADMVDVGYMHEGRWRHIADSFAAAGLMPRDFPLDGFLFDAEVRRDLRWLYGTAAGATLAALAASAVGARFKLLNDRLRREVAQRTEAEAREREAKLAAEEAMRARSRFLAGMGHEFRTPLTSVVGISSLLADTKGEPLGDEQQRHFASLMHEAGRHLLRLVDDLMDLSKIEAGRMEVHPGRVDVAQRVRNAVALLGQQAEAGGVAVAAEVPAATVGIVDERALDQILLNLLSNAVKYTPRGGRVLVRAESPAGRGLLLTVQDTGIGMSADEVGRLFRPFERADNAYAAARGGTGLGLAIVKALVDLHGGVLAVDTRPGEGTTVAITLPETAAASPEPATA
ncbi:MAG TPA: ABC transporter substrate-binding protein [Azospirillaceae bacterium]|nr:ABC transporter substrate-binding protein [Azospirillaceae bacterium]